MWKANSIKGMVYKLSSVIVKSVFMKYSLLCRVNKGDRSPRVYVLDLVREFVVSFSIPSVVCCIQVGVGTSRVDPGPSIRGVLG